MVESAFSVIFKTDGSLEALVSTHAPSQTEPSIRHQNCGANMMLTVSLHLLQYALQAKVKSDNTYWERENTFFYCFNRW